MDELLGWLYAPIQPFVWHEERAFLMALFFIGLFVVSVFNHKGNIRMKQLWPLLLASAFWILFGVNEYISHSSKANIRIDLLFLGPLIMAISLFAIYAFVKDIISRK